MSSITKFVTALRSQLVSFAILKTRTPMTPRFLLGLGDLGNGASARLIFRDSAHCVSMRGNTSPMAEPLETGRSCL
jgi:hypothetical protein